MHTRETFIESALAGIAEGLRTCFADAQPARAMPCTTEAAQDELLDAEARARSIALMRVNHAGEVAAQALYNGQALFARNATTRRHLLAAADDEHDHLAWCIQRIAELGGSQSRLTPLWYAGSFAIGALAGVVGDERSLGFIEETEKQVEAHLEDHLQRLPENDRRSREILEQMSLDEAAHGAAAAARGAVPVPQPGRLLMQFGGAVLRQVAQIM
jgi:ubiquinone biosynthesis monooxygenase Coq7